MPIAPNVQLGDGVRVIHPDLVNLYGCTIGEETVIGPFVEIQVGVTVGARCKIQSHSFLCEGVEIGEGVFVGHGVTFTNDRLPRSLNDDGSLKGSEDWVLERTVVGDGASIGSGVTLLPGIEIGAGAMIGAGAVVTKDVPPYGVALGNPARVVGDARDRQA